jgi:hypothetical protein
MPNIKTNASFKSEMTLFIRFIFYGVLVEVSEDPHFLRHEKVKGNKLQNSTLGLFVDV